MSAAGLRPPPRPFAVALRTTVAAGGWANLLLVLAMLAVPLMARLIGNDKGAYAGLVLAAMFVMFWTMVAGGCLVALCATAAAQRLPRARGIARLRGHPGGQRVDVAVRRGARGGHRLVGAQAGEVEAGRRRTRPRTPAPRWRRGRGSAGPSRTGSSAA